MGNRYVVWQSVKVIDKDHPRFNEAGTVQENVSTEAKKALVTFDKDGATEPVSVDSLEVLR